MHYVLYMKLRIIEYRIKCVNVEREERGDKNTVLPPMKYGSSNGTKVVSKQVGHVTIMASFKTYVSGSDNTAENSYCR